MRAMLQLPTMTMTGVIPGRALARTSDVQLHIGESRDSGFDAEPGIGSRLAPTVGVVPE
jgi:hypothetical protein